MAARRRKLTARRSRLAERRRVVGRSQEKLAQELGVERSTVVRWEAGDTEPRPWLRPRPARVLQLTIEQLDDLLTEPSTRVGTSASPAAITVPAVVMPTTDVEPGADKPSGQLASRLPTGGVLGMDAAESAAFSRFVALGNTDAATVEQLEADTLGLARRYVSVPAAQLHGEIRGLRDVAFTLLRGRQRPRFTSDLLVIASRLCGLCAHICLDAGDYESAATHARTAGVCGEAAGDSQMQAWVLSVESLIAFWGGDHRRAADRAQRGQALSTSPHVVVRLASLEARALAVAGNATGALIALRQAQMAGEMRSADGELPGVLGFPDAKQLTYAGTTYLAIGGARVHDAIACSRSAVASYDELPVEDRSLYDVLAAHLDLARGHLSLGDVDEAEQLLTPVWATSPATLSASILARLRSLSGDVGRPSAAGGTAECKRLRERIEATVAAAPPRGRASAESHP
jgi:DNA-binding XRE family transcriptional regulator